MKTLAIIFVVITVFSFTSCAGFTSATSSESHTQDVVDTPSEQDSSSKQEASSEPVPQSEQDTPSNSRTIFLEGEAISEDDVGGFISWSCQEYLTKGTRTLVEVGYYSNPDLEGLGFILYDGGDTGESTFYSRKGLDRRWDWGQNGIYAFIIEADGTGLYYDFSSVPDGKSKSADQLFNCYQL